MLRCSIQTPPTNTLSKTGQANDFLLKGVGVGSYFKSKFWKQIPVDQKGEEKIKINKSDKKNCHLD